MQDVIALADPPKPKTTRKRKCHKCKGTGVLWSKSPIIGEYVSDFCDCPAADYARGCVPFKPVPISRLTIRVGNRNYRIQLVPM